MKTRTRRFSHPVFIAAEWRLAGDIERLFVKYRCTEPSPAQICYRNTASGPARLSVVIPTLDGSRDGCLSALLKQLEKQNFRDFETIIVKGDPRQGRAINIAAAMAGGEYLLTLDDDTSLPDVDSFSKLVRVMEENPEIGAAGGNNLVPEGAALFVKRAMKEIPRRSWDMVDEITDSDLAEHPCLIMRAAEFKAIGGENELIPRGLDPYLRRELRKAGKRVVVVPEVVYHHLPPSKMRLLVKQFYRNGRDAAFVNGHYPQWVIETPATHGNFIEHVASANRVARFGLRLLRALARGQLILFASEFCYALGYLSYRLCGKAPA